MVDRHKVAEAHSEILRLDGDVLAFLLFTRRNVDAAVTAALLFRQQGNEGRLQGSGSRALHQIRRRTGGEHAARIHRHQPVESGRLFHVGGRHHHAHAGSIGPDGVDQVPELTAR